LPSSDENGPKTRLISPKVHRQITYRQKHHIGKIAPIPPTWPKVHRESFQSVSGARVWILFLPL
jgi:hypothetical protein